MSQSLDPAELAAKDPLAHPAIASICLFEYSYPPGEHLQEFYNALWKAVDPDFSHAASRIARLMPRGHGKSEAACIVFPTWLILRRPEIRIAIISKTADLAQDRTEKVVNVVERYAGQFDVALRDASGTTLETAANRHKEATIEPFGIESQLTGKHFDVIVFDDVADWDNQRTETQRRNLRQYFRDYVDNLGDPDSVLEGGAVQALIGTRKHPQDIYATDVLGSATWDVGVYEAIDPVDWPLVEQRAWTIRGDDGQLHDSIADLPEDVAIATNGVIPDQELDVLWPEHKPAEALLYDIVDGDDSTAIWQRENQQDPEALSGEVFSSEWLIYNDELPKPPTSYEWYAGMDLGLVDDLQAAAEGDSDYTALAVLAWNERDAQGYVHRLRRERGLSVKAAADWARRQLAHYRIDAMRIEQNANRGVAQRLRDNSALPAEGVSSTESKEARIHDLSAHFESGQLQLIGDERAEHWRSFEQDEWLLFPNAAHDDRLDAIELATRCIAVSGHNVGVAFG
jgi:predicted phage terminase large subunit-like protein